MYNRYISSTLQNLNVVFQVEWFITPVRLPCYNVFGCFFGHDCGQCSIAFLSF